MPLHLFTISIFPVHTGNVTIRTNNLPGLLDSTFEQFFAFDNKKTVLEVELENNCLFCQLKQHSPNSFYIMLTLHVLSGKKISKKYEGKKPA